MQPGPVFVIEIVALVDGYQIDDRAFRQIHRLVEHEPPRPYRCSQRMGHDEKATTVRVPNASRVRQGRCQTPFSRFRTREGRCQTQGAAFRLPRRGVGDRGRRTLVGGQGGWAPEASYSEPAVLWWRKRGPLTFLSGNTGDPVW